VNVREWESAGERRDLAGHSIFTLVAPALDDERDEPLLVLHGFPSSSYDFAPVLDELRRTRRVLLFDFLGYGLSDKPDQRYTLAEQADIATAFTAALAVDRVALLTHDMGDTVGGELLARQLDGSWSVEVTRRVLSNGSIYIGMAQLSVGQQLLLALPDEQMAADGALDAATVQAGLAATFSPASTVADRELVAQWELISRADGHRLLPRLIRYIEERRRDEARYTGAIEKHPAPLHVVWGVDDPIAVVGMTDRLLEARPDAVVELLDGVGHYPMIEAPARFAAAVRRGLLPATPPSARPSAPPPEAPSAPRSR
jgi:pimeloyl-ACP methyl ester carboxylesterase